MPPKVPISKNLQEIIKDVSGGHSAPLNENIKTIEEKQCAAVEFYLLAMTQRLELV